MAVSKAERTRQYIIAKTAPLFNVKGYDGTSLQDLTEATGLTKGAIYGNFADKEEIAREAFRYAVGKMRELVQTKLVGLTTSKSKLFAFLDFYAEYVFNPPVKGGCPLINTAVDVDDYHTSLRRVLVKELNSTIGFIEELLQQGVDQGEFKKQTDVYRLAYIIFCSIEGAVMFSRAERSDEPMQIIVSHCKNLLDQLSI